MIIGILAEGDLDLEPLKNLLHNIFNHLNIDSGIKIVPFVVGGSIETHLSKASKLFFNTNPKCDLAIFLNDIDKSPERCKYIRNWVKEYIQQNPDNKIVVGCPDRHFEQWFVSEENTLKSFFNLSGSKPLPYSDKLPKEQLESIFYEFGDITDSLKDVYIELAGKLNIPFLITKDKSFSRFYRELKKELNV